jgi:hypothetical protein
MKEKTKKSVDEKQFSLLHPMATGGIIGGDGYTYQERYIVCHVPAWIKNPQFVRFMYEGTGDVDIVYNDDNQHIYDHVQVKDHQVTPKEFSEVVEGFIKINQATQNVYRRFILASPSLSRQVQSLSAALSRYKNALQLYSKGDALRALQTTKEQLQQKIESLDLTAYTGFLLTKLEFDAGRLDFSDNNTCRDQFTVTLVEHPLYASYLTPLLKPVYSKLIEEVLAHRGKVMEAQKIHELIKTALLSAAQTTQDTVLHVHNWTAETYDPPATFELDWSLYFDRSTRTVPDATAWQNELIPQLQDVRRQIAKATPNRHIIFRGKCALTTGFALGIAFPEIGNWSFELLQYPQTWRSDAQRNKDYNLQYEEVDPGSLSVVVGEYEIAVIFNITGQALTEVAAYLKNNNIAVSKLILIAPSNIPGTLSIQDDSEAVSLASASKDIIKRMATKYNTKTTHLFYFGPLGLSIFIGQKLTSVGQIQFYEFQDPSYKPSCLIKT